MLPNIAVQNEINISRFVKLNRINKGSFGTVYLIEDKITHDKYAAKIIDCGDSEEECNKIINQEIKIVINIKHPTIIKFFGYSKIDFHNENNVTIIMELAKKGSLDNVLKKIRSGDCPYEYTNTTRQIIITGVARAMKYLHDRDIIHYDLKNDNILLDDNFHPHISDFGIPKNRFQFGSTLIYKAPEIFENKPFDKKADVYSFAIVMYEVVEDCFPYPKLEKGELSPVLFANKVMNENYRPEFQYPIKEPLKELIEQCWSKDPNERPTFKEIFNKLTDKNEDCFLDHIDMNEFTDYVEKITEVTDSVEKLLNKGDVLEKENLKLKKENEIQNNEISVINIERKNTQKEQSNQNERINSQHKRAFSCFCFLIPIFIIISLFSFGKSEIIYNFALLYQKGEGFDQNYTKAVELYEKSSKLGNSNAMNNLAFSYQKGEVVNQNYTKAVELYEKSSKLGNSYAMYNLALSYEKGEGVDKNYTKAVELYEQSSKLGNSNAMYNLAILYEKGEGVNQNYTKAFEYLEKSARKGNSSAKDEICSLLSHNKIKDKNLSINIKCE